jgi:hypothetical protein
MGLDFDFCFSTNGSFLWGLDFDFLFSQVLLFTK